MPAGLQVKTPAGILQIDELYRNAQLAAKVAVTSFSRGPWSATYGPNDYVASINTGAYFPCILGFAPVSYPCTTGATLHGVFATFDDATLNDYALNVKSDSAQFDCFLFRDQALASGANHGLQVFNAAGTMVYDSALKYLRVVDFFTEDVTASWTRSYTAGRRYAVCVNKLGYTFTVTHPSLYRVNVKLPLYTWSNSYTISCAPAEFTPAQTDYFDPPTITIPTDQTVQTLILDVTGY